MHMCDTELFGKSFVLNIHLFIVCYIYYGYVALGYVSIPEAESMSATF